jgi:DtxR family Mn-dependent transcriptional regulator
MASEQIEEYLEAIGKMEELGERVSTSFLARELRVAPPSVTEMLKRLSDRGLVSHEPRGEIALTEEGRALARSVMRRHRLWERFLHDVLGMHADRVHDEACKLEHATSPAVEQELERALGDTAACPHGRAIPPAVDRATLNSSVPRDGEPISVPLARLQPGESGTVQSLGSGKTLVARCLALGFTPGTDVTMVRNPRSGPLIVSVRGTRVALGRGEAEKICILGNALGNGSHD